MDRTESKIDTPLTQPGSRLVRYELIDKDGEVWPAGKTFKTAKHAADVAHVLWPDQQEDPDETCEGWHVRVVGS